MGLHKYCNVYLILSNFFLWYRYSYSTLAHIHIPLILSPLFHLVGCAVPQSGAGAASPAVRSLFYLNIQEDGTCTT